MHRYLPLNFRWLFVIAALSFLPALFHYYVGEEAIFPISSLEMWQHGEWLKQYLYGSDLQHNPLFNWLIMPLSALAGWQHVQVVTRALTICATLATGLTLAWLVQRLFRDRAFAAFAALAYLTMLDVLLYHGWLCYVDPLFAMFVFASVAALWVAAHEQRNALLATAGILLSCAFLSKAFTAYLFYGTAALVLLFDSKQRIFLLRRPALLIHAATLAAPLAWFVFLPGGHGQSGRMFDEILHKLALVDAGDYLGRLATYPLEILLWLSPITLLAAYYWLRRRNIREDEEDRRLFRTACWIALLQFLPYWFSPQGGMRYLLPVYPLLALAAARIVWQSGENALTVARNWMVGALALNCVLALVVFPYYQSHYRGKNYDETAADIIMLTQGQPLYSKDVSAVGLSVTAYLDQRRYPAPAVQMPPAEWKNGFVLSLTEDAALGEVHKKYRLGGDELYLLCRGEACRKT